ncbi:MAG TPA: hypothetical protein VLF18_15060 [Tahibacter sp.]|uniref:hypothetical protein n=1 Tax=Tahibacter sp. TaxID=2056211 RepID=UPI002C641B9B|nr:hypothetical protein [Tahibacter sp.]HSX61519.1 hypothetical protein [Tahibacter sp.]
MHRLYSLFPQGRPGLGLIALRVCVAAGLGALAPAASLSGSVALQCVLVILMAGLAGGFLTGLLSLGALALAVVQAITPGTFARFEPALPLALAALALALLGPGAYSIDAWLFGRRVLRIPRRR